MLRKTSVYIAIAYFLFGLLIGFIWGGYQTLVWGVAIVHNFVDIDFDEDMIVRGLWNYKYQINQCFENASIHTDTRN